MGSNNEPRLDSPDSGDSGFHPIQCLEDEFHSLSEWWHNWHPFGASKKAEVKPAPPTPVATTARLEAHVAAPANAQLAAPVSQPEVMPKPDQSGTLTVDFNSKFFNDAIEQGGVKKLVINHQGKADVHVEVEPDGKGGQAFWAVVDEPGVKAQDKKKFLLPGDLDYITINQQQMTADNKPAVDQKNQPIYDPPTNRVAGQLRLQAFRDYFEADSGAKYGGSSTVPLLRGVNDASAPANAGQTGVDDLIKDSGHIPAQFLNQVESQLQHDKAVPQDTNEPWFNIMLGQVHILQAGQELQQAVAASARDKGSLEAQVQQKLQQADQDYQAAMTVADGQLPQGDRQPHLQNGQAPRHFNPTGPVDWNDPATNSLYYSSAKDLAAFQEARLKKDMASLTGGIKLYDSGQETFDQLIPPLYKGPRPATK